LLRRCVLKAEWFSTTVVWKPAIVMHPVNVCRLSGFPLVVLFSWSLWVMLVQVNLLHIIYLQRLYQNSIMTSSPLFSCLATLFSHYSRFLPLCLISCVQLAVK
jgi:hypothetical protein